MNTRIAMKIHLTEQPERYSEAQKRQAYRVFLRWCERWNVAQLTVRANAGDFGAMGERVKVVKAHGAYEIRPVTAS